MTFHVCRAHCSEPPKRRPLTREDKSITLQAEQAGASCMLHQLPSASGGEKKGELAQLGTYSASKVGLLGTPVYTAFPLWPRISAYAQN